MTASFTDAARAYLLACVLYVPVAFGGALLVRTAWQSFVVPLGVPAISLAYAYGLSLLVQFIVVPTRQLKDSTARELRDHVADAFSLSLSRLLHYALLIWIAKALA